MKQLSQIYPVLLLITLLSGCTTFSYYTQAVRGHLALTMAGEPVDDLIASEDTSPELRNKLMLSRRALHFAENRLALDPEDAFTDYVPLDHPWVVVNLVAVPEFSLQPHQWCYPILGCQAYRGYFHLKDAQTEEQRFRAEGYDTFIGGVTAYSTLGWFDDPLHSGFTNLDDNRMVALMFHELAHQVLYMAGDTAFNESFATAVELEGLRLWLARRGDSSAFQKALNRLEKRRHAYDLIATTSDKLKQLYQQQDVLPESTLRERKHRIFDELSTAYGKLHNTSRQQPSGTTQAVFNNARIALFSQYNQYVPAFRQLLKQSRYDFEIFYQAAEALSGQTEEQRRKTMQDLSERFKKDL